MKEAIGFLLNIWKQQCGPGDYVCVSSKGSTWRDKAFPFDNHLAENLEKWFEQQGDIDLYFSPLAYSHPKRRKEFARPSMFLWSDVDNGDENQVPATILWESSPGRHAALWRLPTRIPAEEASKQSKDIAYFIGGDRGGFDLTQVLRIVGTKNHKYNPPPKVKLIHNDGPVLSSTPKRAIDRWRNTIPRALLRTIEGPATVGQRSDMLWKLEHQLADLGIPIRDVIEILKDSDWNKYKNRPDENDRFSSEMSKIIEDRGEKQSVTRVESVEFRVETFSDLMGKVSSSPGWMVNNWWMRSSHGIVAGEPKSFKSTLVMDMLFSVAANVPFLGRHAVGFGGPVLIIQNENNDVIMKDRLEKLSANRGIIGRVRHGREGVLLLEWAPEVPIFFINQQSFTLDDAGNLEALERLIDKLRPVAINLDPLYLMFSGDVNSAKDLNPVLTWCLRIKQEYDCSVILVHHYGKGSSEKRGGQRMLGSTTLHGWIDSAWYIQARDPVNGKGLVTVDREFRGAGIQEKLDLTLDIGDVGSSKYEVLEAEHGSSEDEGEDILRILEQSADAMGAEAIRRKLGISRGLTERLLAQLVTSGSLTRSGERYVLA